MKGSVLFQSFFRYLLLIVVILALVGIESSIFASNLPFQRRIEPVQAQPVPSENVISYAVEQNDKPVSSFTPATEEIWYRTPLDEVIKRFFSDEQIDPDDVSFVITDLRSGKKYVHSPDKEIISASLYKLPLAMLYYDEINNATLSPKDKYYYDLWMVECAGPVSENHDPGDLIALDYLLDMMISNSDNTAGHLLYTHYGGWETMREATLKYTDSEAAPSYYDPHNYMTADYLNDVLMYIFDHQSDYRSLLNSMSLEQTEAFLNGSMPHLTKQKTGYYDQYHSAAGLVTNNNPYAITVLTELGEYGSQYVIGEINRLAYDFFNNQ